MHDEYAFSAISYHLKGHTSTVLPELRNRNPIHKSKETNNNITVLKRELGRCLSGQECLLSVYTDQRSDSQTHKRADMAG